MGIRTSAVCASLRRSSKYSERLGKMNGAVTELCLQLRWSHSCGLSLSAVGIADDRTANFIIERYTFFFPLYLSYIYSQFYSRKRVMIRAGLDCYFIRAFRVVLLQENTVTAEILLLSNGHHVDIHPIIYVIFVTY